MCGLCSVDAEHARAAMKSDLELAETLEAIAAAYRNMAAGRLDPHPDDGTPDKELLAMTERRVRKAIVNLASDWL